MKKMLPMIKHIAACLYSKGLNMIPIPSMNKNDPVIVKMLTLINCYFIRFIFSKGPEKYSSFESRP